MFRLSGVHHVFSLDAGMRAADKGSLQPTAQQKVDICYGIVLFALSQGFQFARVLPSDLLTPGSCRRLFVDATPNYATKAERAHLSRAFARDGCHSCGMYTSHMSWYPAAEVKGTWPSFDPIPVPSSCSARPENIVALHTS